MEIMKRLVREEEGQGMVEYALIAALISIVALSVLTPIGTQIKTKFNQILVGLGGTEVK
ncbi:Flp family type IVb pilin [Trichococcus ilyis]|uniref:Flp/fap pilin component n=1 Tax=Trichococcus ilyis TaxID=640938 RepID=A0A143ZD31_9LACT|nr:Flp family type IVb pilin [Trichococcus ilyis]CZR10371.1 flp/fap pilin component [Trichococcus ilyis]SEJ95143.1 pilus assembly protein Flp/PilA [Trichococcus ilyis]